MDIDTIDITLVESGKAKYYKWPIKTWKNELLKIMKDKKTISFHHDNCKYVIMPFQFESLLESYFGFEVSKIINDGNEIEKECYSLETRTSMVFHIESQHLEPIRSSKGIDLAFKSKLTLSGQNQKEKLKTLFTGIGKLVNLNELYAPYLPLIQSSGYGKSKISDEILKEIPGISIVFRKNRDKGSSSDVIDIAYPFKTTWTDLLINYIYAADHDSLPPTVKILGSQANSYSSGRFLLFLRRIIYLYYLQYKTLIDGGSNRTDAIRLIGELFISDSNVWAENELKEENFKDLEKDTKTIGQVTNSIKYLMGLGTVLVDPYDNQTIERDLILDLMKVKSAPAPVKAPKSAPAAITATLTEPTSVSASAREPAPASAPATVTAPATSENEYTFPFVIFLDELSTLNELSPAGRIPGVNVVRRALHLIDTLCRILVVSIGTNSDTWEFSPALMDDSIRYESRKNLVPSIWLSCNFDTLWRELNINQIKVDEKLLLNKNVIKLLMTMGRPLWPATIIDDIVLLACRKLKNGGLDSLESLCSLLFCRVNVNVSPTSVFSRRLVKSHMATVAFIDADASAMKVHYPSEPALVLGSRLHLKSKSIRANAFRAMATLTERQVLDKGRHVEAVHEHAVLFAIDDAIPSQSIKFTEDNHEYSGSLRSVLDCNPGKYLHSLNLSENANAPRPSDSDMSSTSTSPIFQFYKVITVTDFLRSFFHANYDLFVMPNISHLPEHLLNGYINATHFVNLEEDSGNILSEYFQMPKEDFKIDRRLLNMGLLRGCGWVMPPNMMGLDFILPVLPSGGLPPTYIGFQSKSSMATYNTAISKTNMLLHMNQSSCKQYSSSCDCCYTKNQFNSIVSNQLVILMSLEGVKEKLRHENAKFYMIPQENDNVKRSKTEGLSKAAEKRNFNEMMIESANERFGINITGPPVINYVEDKFPKFEDAPCPDFIMNAPSLSDNISVKRMIWNENLDSNTFPCPKHQITCILSHDISNQVHLFGKEAIKDIKDMINGQRSFLANVSDFHKDIAIDSMINGTFSPVVQFNPQLRAMSSKKIDELSNINADNLNKSIEECLNRSNKSGEKLKTTKQ